MKQRLWKSGIKNELQQPCLKQPSTTLVFNTALTLYVRLECAKDVITICMYYFLLKLSLELAVKNLKRKTSCKDWCKTKTLSPSVNKSPLKWQWEISDIKLATKTIIVIPTSIRKMLVWSETSVYDTKGNSENALILPVNLWKRCL